MDQLLDILVSAIPLAFQYMLVGLAWVVVFRSTGVLNFATGQYVVFGALTCYTLINDVGVPFVFGIVLAALIIGLLGMVSYTALLRPMAGQAPFAQVIMTFGLSIILVGLIPIIWGDAALRIPSPYENTPFVRLPRNTFWTTIGFATMVVGAAVLLAILVFLRKVRVGTQMEAAAERPLLAAQSGININRLFSLSWGMALIPAALGGISVGLATSVGAPLAVLGLRALAPVIVGGLESIPGVFVGSLIVAVFESMAILWLGSDAQDAAVFLLLLVVLIFRPYGIFGRAEVRRV